MMDWLNNNIGTDLATYVSLFIALVSMLTVVKWHFIRKSNKQVQKNTSGTNIQIGGNVNIDAGEDDAIR